MSSYHDALRYLYSLVDYEKRRIERYDAHEFKLDRVETLLARLGNPQRSYPTLHIAGTKGKGSVSALLGSIAQAAGLKVGLYTSPHLHTYRERMQINKQPISRRAMTKLVNENKAAIESISGLTTFEVTTALAFLYFAQQKVDLGVIEVGLGGRLDATNVIRPKISIITSLSLDHTYLLGDTLAEIAGEKGGIIKPQTPVVSAPQKPEALAVLESIAAERNAPMDVVGRDWKWESQNVTLEGQTLEIYRQSKPSPFDGGYKLSLLGDFQQENATIAVATVARLMEAGEAWATPQAVQHGLAQTEWPGRLEVLNHSPLLLVDCAHNPYSTEVLAHTLKHHFPEKRWILVYGASLDKDIPSMLGNLLPLSEKVIVTRSYHPRAAAPSTLADNCAELGYGAEIAVNARRALEQAHRHLGPDVGILVTGSIFLVADIREAWGDRGNLRVPLGDWIDEPWEKPA